MTGGWFLSLGVALRGGGCEEFVLAPYVRRAERDRLSMFATLAGAGSARLGQVRKVDAAAMTVA